MTISYLGTTDQIQIKSKQNTTQVDSCEKKCLARSWSMMMTSSNGNIFRATGPLWGEFTGHRWIPLTKARVVELWCFLICAWTNGWENHWKTGDLRRHRAHYDVSVMFGNFPKYIAQHFLKYMHKYTCIVTWFFSLSVIHLILLF